MVTSLLIVLPIFALILAGFLVRRRNIMGPSAARELNRFVVYMALPALLFDIVAHVQWHEVWRPQFVGTFTLSTAAIFLFLIVWRARGSRHLADTALDALNGSYANTGFIGFPLLAVVFGSGSAPLVLIATIITACVLFAATIVFIEVSLQSEPNLAQVMRKVGFSICRNPLILAPALGAIFPIFGLNVPASLETFLKLLGTAASPCALVTLGLFLGEKRTKAALQVSTCSLLSGCKLLLHPLLTWLFGAFVFSLSPAELHMAVVIAALPTGTGPFMLAELYGREAQVTANTILVTTVFSLLTVSLYIAFIA